MSNQNLIFNSTTVTKKDPLNPPLRDMSLRFLVAGLSGKVAGYLPKNRPIFVLFNLFSKLV